MAGSCARGTKNRSRRPPSSCPITSSATTPNCRKMRVNRCGSAPGNGCSTKSPRRASPCSSRRAARPSSRPWPSARCSRTRSSNAAVVLTERSDLVIVGGGIHGAGVAQAAAARGHSVLVLEQTTHTTDTTSRSSKLIHGGLRYLESGQFALVRECLHERALLLKLAPELVRMQPFYLPLYGHARSGAAKERQGMIFYALVAGLGADTRLRVVLRVSVQG